MCKQKLIAEKIERIIEILDELQYCESNQLTDIQQNQVTILQGIEKLQEYNEIDDMVNTIFAKKLQEIEQKL